MRTTKRMDAVADQLAAAMLVRECERVDVARQIILVNYVLQAGYTYGPFPTVYGCRVYRAVSS